MKFQIVALAALLSISESQAYQLKSHSVNKHACDFLDDHGEDINTSFVDNDDAKPVELTMVQMKSKLSEDDDTPEAARQKFALMQAQMEANVQAADEKKAQQDAVAQNTGDDPQSQLQGLMNAQQSLKRIGSAFSTKPNEDKIAQMA